MVYCYASQNFLQPTQNYSILDMEEFLPMSTLNIFFLLVCIPFAKVSD